MKKPFYIVAFGLACTLLLASCFESAVDPYQVELSGLETYIEKTHPTVAPTKSGLYFVPQRSGIGARAIKGDTVFVQYIGRTISATRATLGDVFDNTYTNGNMYTYVVDTDPVIKGFAEGIKLMRTGQTAFFIMSSKLAYGERRNGPIPAYSSLHFEVEIVEIRNGAK